MAFIPSKIRYQSIILSMRHLLLSQGKVGDKYRCPLYDSKLVSVRSDRLSVFDFVLLLSVLYKGQVLTALTDFWAREILNPLGINHHLADSMQYPGWNMAKDLKVANGFADLDLTRTLVIKEAKVMPFELIFRHHVGGSVWKKYQETGIVAGVQLPSGLKKWQKLDEPMFTPSTKAEGGHDVNITVEEFFAVTGDAGHRVVDMLTEVYKEVYRYCEARGILILDTKNEGDETGRALLDEWYTPDSSRFVKKDEYLEAFQAGKEPPFMDKQPVRDYCATIETPFTDKDGKQIIGFKDLEPDNPAHVEFVASYQLPQAVADATTARYLEIFQLLTGMELRDYQEKYLL